MEWQELLSLDIFLLSLRRRHRRKKNKSVEEFFNFIYLFFSNFLLHFCYRSLSIEAPAKIKEKATKEKLIELSRGKKKKKTSEAMYKLGLMFNYLDRIEISAETCKKSLNALNAPRILGFPRNKVFPSRAFLSLTCSPPATLIPSRFWQPTHFHLNICSITHRTSNKNFLTSSKTVREQKFAYNQLDCHKSSSLVFFVVFYFWRPKTREESGSNYSYLWQMTIN